MLIECEMDTADSVYDGIHEVNAFVGHFEDIHICGACRAEFNNLEEFLHHKQRCKLVRKIQLAREQRRLKSMRREATQQASTNDFDERPIIVNERKADHNDTHLNGYHFANSLECFHLNSLPCEKPDVISELSVPPTVELESDQIHVQIINNDPDYPTVSVLDNERVLNVGLENGTAERHSIHLDIPVVTAEPPIFQGPLTLKNKSKIYRCNYAGCSYDTGRAGDLSRHLRTHAGVSTEPCSFCGVTFSRPDALKRHQALHGTGVCHQCDQCSYSSTDKSTLRRHVQRMHSKVEKPYKCNDCSSTFHERSKLLLHQRSYTDDRPYSCSICAKCFYSKSDLSRHERVHSEEKPYQCDHCQFSTKFKHNLTVHVKSHHSASASVTCDQCDFTTSSKHKLRQHKRLHQPQLFQTCAVCHKSVRKSSIYIHMQSHNETRLECHVCDFRTKYRHSLGQHLQKIHGLVSDFINAGGRTLLPDSPVTSYYASVTRGKAD